MRQGQRALRALRALWFALDLYHIGSDIFVGLVLIGLSTTHTGNWVMLTLFASFN